MDIHRDAYNEYHTYGFDITSDGGCILLADTQSLGAGNHDVWLVKLDSRYSVEWEKAINVDFPRTVVYSGDGGYVIGTPLAQVRMITGF